MPIHDDGRVFELHAEPPVEWIEASVVGKNACEPRELHADQLVVRLMSDEPRLEKLASEREHVVERRVHAGSRIARGIEPKA